MQKKQSGRSSGIILLLLRVGYLDVEVVGRQDDLVGVVYITINIFNNSVTRSAESGRQLQFCKIYKAQFGQ